MFEPIAGIYRFNEKNGKYDSCCTLTFEGDTVTIKGVDKAICKSLMRELETFLKRQGVKIVFYRRRNKLHSWRINNGN